MAFYHCLFLVLILSSPLFAVKCYSGDSDSYNPYSGLQIAECNGKYCTREVVSYNIGNNNAPVYSYYCGDSTQTASRQICTSSYDSKTYSFNGQGTVNKMCCKGDYCNSTASAGSLFAVIASVAALLFNKMI